MRSAPPTLVVYVDVDDTLVRSVGEKRIPIPAVVRHVRALAGQEGVMLYCWSSGGAEYARAVAEELGIAGCFAAFLPKPHVFLDDQAPGEWRRCLVVHPAECDEAQQADDYRRAVAEK